MHLGGGVLFLQIWNLKKKNRVKINIHLFIHIFVAFLDLALQSKKKRILTPITPKQMETNHNSPNPIFDVQKFPK